ncbi:MAG: SDR family oxidoreductase [Candidatus Parvarchaeota archaeon]|nr:SDR family oxidoreductase [Candidatus Jingweiarchaeum tengchongense]
MVIDKFYLKDRVAVVTGGNQGIGFEIAKAMAEAGALVIVGDISEESLEIKTLRNSGRKIDYVFLDVRDSKNIDQVSKKIFDTYGHIDILANIAGIVVNTPLLETTDEEWEEVINVNLNGVFRCSRSFGKYMAKDKKGCIINMASMSGIVVNTPQPQASYNASKAGVILLTKSMASELAPFGIRVNAIAPGYVATPLTKKGMSNKEWSERWLNMTPMKRVAEPEEIAPLALFLASDASSFMTGSVVIIDGGYTIW